MYKYLQSSLNFIYRIKLLNYKYQKQLIVRIMSTDKQETLLSSSDSWFNKYKSVAETPEGLFKGVIDRFNGITIDSTVESCEINDFESKLLASLQYWTDENRRGIWFKVHLTEAFMVPVLAKHNFSFHHAKEDFVMMYNWLPKTEFMNIPPYAHTMCGVGAVVINDKNEVLVVSERNALIKDSWKLPGGYMERNENIVEAGMREVFEETNIETEFETMIAIRHAHGAGFGCSDLYLVVALKPTTSNINKCDREIAKCKWMPIDEYLNHPHVHETNRSFVRSYLKYKENGVKIICREDVHQILKKKYNIFEISLDK